MIAKDNRGNVWTASFKDADGSKTDRQMREGTPENATHIVRDGKAAFWVQGDLKDLQSAFPGCVVEAI